MSRAKSKQNTESCGDCGALDATWASVNKGILLCTQCCSIHRTLGKHISHVKSLLKSSWPKNQLELVHSLNNNGANNIWEHALLENNSKLLRKKPGAKDSLSTKQAFIHAKHKECSFAFRENYEDGRLSVENELGKQLHASVRTPNLETSFRLLTLGADPNYFHDEKNSTPLHVAVKSEQRLQVELLLIYGADPTCPDSHGKTPIDFAKLLVSKDLSNRLIESQYEVTDTFCHYLTRQKPDHSAGIHFLLPTTGFKSNPTSLQKLQKLANHVFEELTMDVFDEIDRRETEAIWLSCADTTEYNDVPFLPVDNTLSTTRNQGRQKLARFTTPELKSLVYDILVDTQRRQMNVMRRNNSSMLSEEDPVYDSVASDDDYALPPSEEGDQDLGSPQEIHNTKAQYIEGKRTTSFVDELTKSLRLADATIVNLRDEIKSLKENLHRVQDENNELRNQLSKESSGGDEVDIKLPKRPQRPSSMYETREGITNVPNWHALKAELKDSDASRNATQSLYSTPDRKTILQCAEHLTRSIKTFVASIQNIGSEDIAQAAEKVRFSVFKIASNVPKDCDAELIKSMLKQITEIKEECLVLQQAHLQSDSRLIEQHFNKIRDCVYQLASCTKEIVRKYSSGQ